MKTAQLTTQQVLSGEQDKYAVHIGKSNYCSTITCFDYKEVLHCLRCFSNSYGEPEFVIIGHNPKYKGDVE